MVTLREDFVQGKNRVNTTQPFADIRSEVSISRYKVKQNIAFGVKHFRMF